MDIQSWLTPIFQNQNEMVGTPQAQETGGSVAIPSIFGQGAGDQLLKSESPQASNSLATLIRALLATQGRQQVSNELLKNDSMARSSQALDKSSKGGGGMFGGLGSMFGF